MSHTIKTIIKREAADECTFAVVTAICDEQIKNPRQLQEVIVQGVTKWMAETKEGREAFQRTSGDFNIGDLSTELTDDWLDRFFQDAGLEDLDIETFCEHAFNAGWHYDTLLFDEIAVRAAHTRQDVAPKVTALSHGRLVTLLKRNDLDYHGKIDELREAVVAGILDGSLSIDDLYEEDEA